MDIARARIGLDYWPATTHASGVGRYARELVRALCALEGGPRLCLFDVGPRERIFEGEALGLAAAADRVQRLRAGFPRRALRPLRALLGLSPERMLGGCDLFHRVFAGDPPPGRAPQVLAVSELPSPGDPLEERLRARLRPIGDAFVFSSQAARELAERFQLRPERIHRLPVGCDHWARDLAAEALPVDPPRILALGRVDRRRGVRELLAAFETLRTRGTVARLAFAGGRGDAARDLEAWLSSSRFRGDAAWIERPAERDLPALVAGSAALVHISSRELTPVTPLEAMALGCSVLASPLEPFREALGAEALWVEPQAEAGALADLLERGLEAGLDPSARRRRKALASGFTWERHARLTLAAWQTILAR